MHLGYAKVLSFRRIGIVFLRWSTEHRMTNSADHITNEHMDTTYGWAGMTSPGTATRFFWTLLWDDARPVTDVLPAAVFWNVVQVIPHPLF
jgi:hypothetical protein